MAPVGSASPGCGPHSAAPAQVTLASRVPGRIASRFAHLLLQHAHCAPALQPQGTLRSCTLAISPQRQTEGERKKQPLGMVTPRSLLLPSLGISGTYAHAPVCFSNCRVWDLNRTGGPCEDLAALTTRPRSLPKGTILRTGSRGLNLKSGRG